jgi:hypothetical protein
MTGAVAEAHGPEREIALDMARLGLLVGPVFMAVATLIWSLGGLLSSALAFVIVVGNLLLGAWLIGRAAAVSPNLLMGAVLGGFALRLLTMTLLVVPIRGYDWFEVAPFAVTLIGGHLGLLAWETQRVSATLAFPGLRPSKHSGLMSARARSKSE